MQILTINCGSSSLKATLYAANGEVLEERGRATVDAIGSDQAALRARVDGTWHERMRLAAADYRSALTAVLEAFGDCREVAAVGHRVVYGGSHRNPVIIDPSVIEDIERGSAVAPLHNIPALRGIEAARERMPMLPMVAVFDTQFHATIPRVAAEYALPRAMAARHGVRRIGYHGIAHQSMVERFAAATGRSTSDVNLITLQLGNGCSATAVASGMSIDTSMGFTPLEGLVMGTRSGDIDPGAVIYLSREEGLDAGGLDELLNRQSGLFGMSGVGRDVREVLRAEAEGSRDARLAIDVFCYRARKYIGAYFAVLGRVDAIIFGGGIGEHQPEIRQRVCEPLRLLGVVLDAESNTRASSEGARRISDTSSTVEAWVVPTDEESIIARETYRLVRETA